MSTGDSQKLKVFISYSRDDLAFADQLCAGLEATGFQPTLDRIGISGAADWRETLRGMILKSDTVVFVLSPSSARSEMCAEEVAVADGLAKRIIPVVCQPLAEAPVPRRLQDLNYIFFYAEPKSPGSGFGSGLTKLKAALELDQGWMREHTRYTDRATEWDGGGRVAERLLQGADIAVAQKWMHAKPAYSPDTTPLQVAFIDASAAAETGRIAAQAAREATARDAEVKRINAEREADRLKLEAAKISAERAAAQAESRRRRSQLLISLPAVLLAIGGGAGWVIQRNTAELERKTAQQAVTERQLAEARAEAARAETQLAENKALLAKLNAKLEIGVEEARQSVIERGPAAKTAGGQVPPPPVAVAVRPAVPAASVPGGRDSGGSGGAGRGPAVPYSATHQGNTVSQAAVELMVAYEVADQATYEAKFESPVWPAGQLGGIVFGIGYDLGYTTPEQFAVDWKSRLPAADFERLAALVGLKGAAAQARLDSVADIRVPFDTAMAVFRDVTLQRFTATTLATFPNANELPPDSFGALVSLVYNRGSSLGGERRKEMRNIHDLMEKRQFDGVPAQFRAMKILWKDVPGLQKRREAEATLFEKGLAQRALELAATEVATPKKP